MIFVAVNGKKSIGKRIFFAVNLKPRNGFELNFCLEFKDL